MGYIFSVGSGVADSVFGKCEAPIRAILDSRGEAFEKKSMLGEFFRMERSENGLDAFTSMTAMNGFEPTGENGAYPADSMEEGYKKIFTYETWKDSFSISAEAIADGKVMDLRSKPTGFIKGWHRTREIFGASIYGGWINGQSSITYGGKKFDITGADGLPLFHKAHKPKVKGAAQSNLFSDAFSVEALDRAEAAMQQIKGDNGEILTVSPTTIAIPNLPDLKRKVFAAIGADKDPNSAGNGFNFQFGRWKVKIWSVLNDFVGKGVEPWILMDDDYNEECDCAKWIDREQLSVRSRLNDDNDANVWQGRGRFGAGFVDWRFACCGGMAGGVELSSVI